MSGSKEAPTANVSWNEPGETGVHNYKKGQEVEALAFGVDRERISLGVKQLDAVEQLPPTKPHACRWSDSAAQ